MAIVAPSILSADFANLERDMHVIRDAGAPWAHVDIMDGHFVPNITIGIPVVKALRRVSDLTLDVHLMITEPGRYAEAFCKAGADFLTVHLEADYADTAFHPGHGRESGYLRQAGYSGGSSGALPHFLRYDPYHDGGARLRWAEVHGGHDG